MSQEIGRQQPLEVEGQPPDGAQARAASVSIEASYSGPIPQPSALQAYELIVPGAAERIIRNSEIESEYRRERETEDSQRDHFRSMVGMACGYAVAIIIISVALAAILEGHAWPAVAILGSGLVAVVKIFVEGSKKATGA